MAGNENSGGYRPTAPQNNTGVSATGGNGSADGVPNISYTGMGYGQNKLVNDAMDSGLPMGASTPTSGSGEMGPMAGEGLPQVVPVTAPSTTPERGISYGMPFGDGPDSIPLPQGLAQTNDPSRQIIRALYQQNPRNEDLRFLVETMDNQAMFEAEQVN
jgi:hypothetical protein